VHDDFKIWYLNTYNSQKIPLKREMKKHFEKKYGRKCCTPTHLIGFTINQNPDNEDDV